VKTYYLQNRENKQVCFNSIQVWRDLEKGVKCAWWADKMCLLIFGGPPALQMLRTAALG